MERFSALAIALRSGWIPPIHHSSMSLESILALLWLLLHHDLTGLWL
jgi:hypothetical protein